MPNRAAEQKGTNSATRQALYSGQAIASIFLRRCTSKDGDEPIPFPKLNVVLAIHLLGSTSRSLLIDAVELRGADHSSVASITNTLYRMMAVPSKGDHHRSRMFV